MTANVAAVFILLLYLHKCQHMSTVLYNYELVSTTMYSMSKYLLGKVEQRRQQLKRKKMKLLHTTAAYSRTARFLLMCNVTVNEIYITVHKTHLITPSGNV